MLSQVYDAGHARNAMPRFLMRIQASRLPTFLAMLRMVGYSPTVFRNEDQNDGTIEILMQIVGSDDVASVLLAWLRTIPEIELVTLI